MGTKSRRQQLRRVSVCDGIGELWFDSPAALEQALDSTAWAATVEDAKCFLDMERTTMIIVSEHTIIE